MKGRTLKKREVKGVERRRGSKNEIGKRVKKKERSRKDDPIFIAAEISRNIHTSFAHDIIHTSFANDMGTVKSTCASVH